MASLENRSSLRYLPNGHKRRSLPRVLGFDAHELLALALFVFLISPFWAAASLALITAAGLQPLMRKLEKKLHFRQANRAFFVVSLLSVGLVGMTTYTAVRVARLTVEFARQSQSPTAADPTTSTGGDAGVEEASEESGAVTDSLRSLGELRTKLNRTISRWAPSYRREVESFLNALPKNAVAWIASHAQSFVTNTVGMLAHLGFYFLFLFYFLSHGRHMLMHLFRRPQSFAPRLQLWYRMIETASYTSVVSTAAIGFIQASIVSISYLVLGLSEWALVFFACLILSFVPMLGAAFVPFIIGTFSLLNGETRTGLILFAISAFVGTIDNILRAKFVSSDKNVSQIIAFVGLIGAITLLGFPGLLIGPFLISLAALLLSEKAREGFRPL